MIVASLLTFVAGAIVAFAVFYLYWRFSIGVCKSRRRLDGKTVIITGGNAGIGLETAKALAKRGARIILACRDLEKANAACEMLKTKTKNEEIVVQKLDLSSLKSVRNFVAEFLATESRLDVLINNAGVAGLRKRITEDGLESQFCTNYFGPFLLTLLLIPLMEKTGNARILLLSSEVHRVGTDIDFENLNAEKQWIGKKIYPWNKFCQVLFTRELHRRLKDINSTISVNVLHPGIVRTDIFNTSKGVVYLFSVICWWWFFISPWEGAQTTIYLAVSEQVEGVSGFYWTNCAKRKPARRSRNRELARKLWEVSVKMVKMQPHESKLI